MRSRKLVALVALTVVSACATDIPAPATMVAVPGGTVRRLMGPNGISNSQKYLNAGIKPGTGRSGSATLEARALIAMDGSTFVEATTGSLESGTSAGTIAKAQLKVVGGPQTQNFNGLNNDGYWSTTEAGLYRGQSIQVQANVRGIDPKRTDVVTVTTPVARRPDVAVPSISAPNTTPPNVPVAIVGTVSELNGDVGARTDCVLSVNGVVADQATGIWVDAGGVVSCLFMHAFTSPGTNLVSVTANNVAPGDWDGTNNSASASVTVAASSGTIQRGYLQVSEYHYSHDSYDRRDGPYAFDYQRFNRYEYSNVYFEGNDDGMVPGPYQTAEATISHNGATVHSVSIAPQYHYYNNDGTYANDCTYSSSMGVWVQMCAYSGPGYAYTYYNFQVVAGTVTYYGSQYTCNPGYGCEYYTYNGVDVYSGGVTWGLVSGSNVSVNLRFVDANGVAHTAVGSTTLDHYPVSYTYGPSCWLDGYGNYCYGYAQNGFYLHGYSYW